MNESEKNIETCLPESILAEVASVPTDPQFVSLVEESFDPLQQQAVQQAGSDAYNEVVASHQPYTFTSSVRQMKSNLILLLRRLWRFPFGTGTIRSLSDMWAHYITRLQGSETYGIPSRLDQLTDLPSAPLLVADRKISGVPEAEDGISLVHLLADPSAITELTDDNRGWTCSVNIIPRILSAFPNAKTLTIGCGEYNYGSMTGNVGDKTVKFPYMTKLVTTDNFGIDITAKRVEFPEVTSWNAGSIKFTHCSDEWYMPKVTEIINSSALFQVYTGDNITLMHFGPLTTALRLGWDRDILPNCMHIEFTSGVDANLNLGYWNPTNVLADQDNLQQFLSNFRSFIVLRLANRKTTTALTLTLSAAVYNAVTGANRGWASQHTLADLGITDNDLTDLETELGITSATIYATWLDTYTGANGIHWDINKAN